MEGAITIVAAIVAFFFLPNTPGTCKFLTEHERYVAAHRLRVDLQGGTSKEDVEEEKFSWPEVRAPRTTLNAIG